MRKLLAGTCLLPLTTLPGVALAQTMISTTRTTPVLTSTAGDVTIGEDGAIELAGGTAVTVDSANSVSSAGDITITDADGATGILVYAGTSGTITNSGTITLDESYEAEDSDDDEDLDGPFAEGSGRYGIRTLGALTGSIADSGTTTVQGNDSAGIYLGGTLDGSLTSSGTISVVGDNGYGVRTGDVTGSVTLNGSISVTGEGSIGYASEGDIGGALVIQGSVYATGYRYTSSPADTSVLEADDLLQGGPAVWVQGDVGGGILLASPPSDNDEDNDDEDGDGVADSEEGTASVTAYAGRPALLVGSADAITIGAIAGDATGAGLAIDGGVIGYGIYEGIDGTGVMIGGQGGTVSIEGGIRIGGSVAAYSLSDATGFAIADGATVPLLTNSGTIAAAGGYEAGELSRALLITAGGSLPSLVNSGAIGATTYTDGTAYGVQDLSGTLASIGNSGTIAASSGSAGNSIAIDVSANTSGVTLTQFQSDVEDAAAPGIVGDIRFGSGSDVLAVSAGTVSGDIAFGAGDNVAALSGTSQTSGGITFGAGDDRLTLADSASLAGDVDFGGGSDVMTLSGTASFAGAVANSAGLGLNVDGGSFLPTNTGTLALSSLTVGSGGTIGVTIGADGSSTGYAVAGAASFATGSTLDVSLSSVLGSEGSFTVVTAGALTGTPTATLPYLFDSSLAADGNSLTLTIAHKSASALGLNRWEGAAYDAVLSVIDSDADMAAVLLDKSDQAGVRSVFRQMLPDHGGGTFETVTAGSRAAMRFLEDQSGPKDDRGFRLLLQQVGWSGSKSAGQTAAYDILGWGMVGGAEIDTGIGTVGGTLAYLIGRNSDGGSANEVLASQYETSLFWRLRRGGFAAYARGSAGWISFDSRRFFVGDVDGSAVERTAKADWGGTLVSGAVGASYALQTGRLSLRPIAAIDYYRLNEDARTETGGGTAFDLNVVARKSDELAATTSLAISYDLRKPDADGGYFRVEAEGGLRTILGGSIDSTVASFSSGASFTLDPEQRADGWLARLRLSGGDASFGISGEASAEERQGSVGVGVRAMLRTAF